MRVGAEGAEPPPGGVGAETGEPGTSVKAPFGAIDMTEIVLLVALRTKRNWSAGSVTTKPPSRDSGKGDPDTAVRAPEESTEKAATCEVEAPGIEA